MTQMLTYISADTEQAIDPIRGVPAHPELRCAYTSLGRPEVGMARQLGHDGAVGDDVVVAGLFVNRPDEYRNIPIIRTVAWCRHRPRLNR